MKKTETPDVPDHLLKDEVLRVLREREKISTKEIISMFMTNIKREKEEKDKRYAHFAAILKEVAVVEEVNKERWVKLKK
jgi:ribosomal protein S19E (S16A)